MFYCFHFRVAQNLKKSVLPAEIAGSPVNWVSHSETPGVRHGCFSTTTTHNVMSALMITWPNKE